MVRLIGITGGIGSGKSVVSRVLRCKGYEVYDCDSRAKSLMEKSDRLKCLIRERFGDECLLQDGTINRGYLACRVFGDDSHRLWLNSQVHGMVCRDIADCADKCAGEVMFVESAILKSSGLDAMCNEIWLVKAFEETRLRRVESRDGCDKGHILLRMEAQKSEFEGFSCTVCIIRNDDDASLLAQIDGLLGRHK